VKTVVDMSPAAVEARIRKLSELSPLDDPFRPRVDMSEAAVEARIRELSEMSALCWSLAEAGRSLPAEADSTSEQ
jgi:hypothetical protein